MVLVTGVAASMNTENSAMSERQSRGIVDGAHVPIAAEQPRQPANAQSTKAKPTNARRPNQVSRMAIWFIT